MNFSPFPSPCLSALGVGVSRHSAQCQSVSFDAVRDLIFFLPASLFVAEAPHSLLWRLDPEKLNGLQHHHSLVFHSVASFPCCAE